jgi:putative solute:sodium symporter small subunit
MLASYSDSAESNKTESHRIGERRRNDAESALQLSPCEGQGVPARGAQEGTVADTNEEAHWRRTTNLMLTHLAIWFFFGYVIHMFVNVLNKITIPVLGFPLGFYMAAQGSLIVFVVMLFVFARQQDQIDRDHGFAEDD